MYTQFGLVGMVFNPDKDHIAIEFSLALEASTVNLNTLILSDKEIGEEVPFTVSVDKNSVYVKPTSSNTSVYIVTLRRGITSITGDKLDRTFRYHVATGITIEDRPTISYPVDFQRLDEPRLEIKPDKADVSHYEVEVSSDTAFHKKSFRAIVSGKTKLNYDLPAEGQYYVRVRTIDGDEHGVWSDAVSFIYEADSCDKKGDEANEGPSIETDLICTSQPESGTKPKSFIFEFDEDIDEFIGRIKVEKRLI